MKPEEGTRKMTKYTTYTKLLGGVEWGLRGENLVSGQTVIVRRRDGITKREVVGHVLSNENGICIATIKRFERRQCVECDEMITHPGQRCHATGSQCYA